MSREEVVIAGFGGQGVLLIGKLLAQAALDAGREVSWLPSYGPEMRGGTANCTVVVSDDPIASPIVDHPRGVVAMNRPSLDKFEGSVEAGGFLVINSSMVDRGAERTDLLVVNVRSLEMAQELGNVKAANMIVLGALAGLSALVGLQQIRRAVEHAFEQKPRALEVNLRALEAGHALAQVEIARAGAKGRGKGLDGSGGAGGAGNDSDGSACGLH
ncbi:MAG: 2-oxoacid:acceptor oxidoreductase family protein [Candidatus Wallbacteria bacterium]|nr:2-oxoacid:acceptor oxidoreductase family protein [Candidatus Wallbacteria bacterium]